MQEIWADGVLVTTTPHGVALVFSATIPPSVPGGTSGSPEPKVLVRVPTMTAKELALILRQQLKFLEQQMESKIQLPPGAYDALRVKPEDW